MSAPARALEPHHAAVRRWCLAAPQRGSRPPADGRLRGARGVPGARRVAQPPAARGLAGARVRRRGRRRRRVRRRARHRRPAPRQPGRGQDPRPRRVDRQGRRAALARGRAARSPTRARTFDFFERSSVWDAAPERFRLHGVATQRAADRLAQRGRLRGPRPPDGHRAAARHRQARPHARLPGLPRPGARRRPHAGGAHPPRAPRARRRPRAGRRRARPPLGPAEGRRLGHRAPPRRRRDRRGRLRPPRRHARPLRAGRPGLADRAAEDRARRSASARPSCARSCTTCRTRRPAARARSTRARCPTASSRCSSAWPRARSTSRSRHELELSTSTVRTHLHNIYGKLGAVDRAQAVLIATERGWL